MSRVRILAIDGSPTGGGRTRMAIQTVLTAAQEAGADANERWLGAGDTSKLDTTIEAMSQADAFVLGSPIYRASYASPLKILLDRIPRGMWGETSAPLQGKPVVIVATGASLHHFLALNDFRNVLVAFFAAHVVPPGLYVPREGFGEDGLLLSPYRQQADLQGQALVELARVIKSSVTLGKLTPQA